MSAEILKGVEVNKKLNEKIKASAARLRTCGVIPALAILRVGERDDDIAYENMAVKRCANLGVEIRKAVLPENVKQQELMAVLEELNNDDTVHGVLVFRPLPKHLDEKDVCRVLKPDKDVDGITDGSLAGVFAGSGEGFAPCTAEAAMEILDYYGVDVTGKRAVIVGRSLVIGRPVAMMLMRKNATITICHTKTADMPSVTREADILIVAAGKAGIIDAHYLRPGQIVIDVGIHAREDGTLCGDVRYEEAEMIADKITPVPGGVGTVTTNILIKHVVEAAERKAGLL